MKQLSPKAIIPGPIPTTLFESDEEAHEMLFQDC